MVTGVVLDLVEHVSALAAGQSTEVPIGADDGPVVAAWCLRTGNELVAVRGSVAVVRRGRPATAGEVLAALPADQRPGARLWLYTNFDCNLACDYCCAESSPRTPRRALGLARIRRLVEEADRCGVGEVFLTGGEPFLLPDIDEIVDVCAAVLPTTMLTNGMLLTGRRLERLRGMPRDRLTLQISLDSATPELHDRHRGAGSWRRAVAGIRTALAEGFRVRVAATVAAGESDAEHEAAFRDLLDGLGIARDDQLVRPVAQRGFADSGVVLTVESLIPEITVTADGVYWHPVAADHADQLVSRDLFPFDAVLAEVRRRLAEHLRTSDATARRFPCA